MMNQPLGRLTALQYRHIAPQPGGHPTMPVLRVHFRAPDAEHYHHDLPNGNWALTNASLQFMALWGYQPSELGGTMHDATADKTLIPVTPTGNGGYAIAQTAMQGGQEALREAEWFDPEVAGVQGEEPTHGPTGGPGPDPGTGNRGGVEDPSEAEDDSGVTAELTPEADTGIEVTVE